MGSSNSRASATEPAGTRASIRSRLTRGMSRRSRASSSMQDPAVLAAIKKLRREQLYELARQRANKLTPEGLAEATRQNARGLRSTDVHTMLNRMRRGDLEQVVLKLLADGDLVYDDNDQISAPTEIQQKMSPAERIKAAFAANDPKATGFVGLDEFIRVMSQPEMYENVGGQEPLDEEQLVQLFAEHDSKGSKKIDHAQFASAWSAKAALQSV